MRLSPPSDPKGGLYHLKDEEQNTQRNLRGFTLWNVKADERILTGGRLNPPSDTKGGLLRL